MQHIISLASSSSDRDAAIAYVKNSYRKKYGTTPGESEIYITARHDGHVTGVIGLDFADVFGKMPLESIYTINRDLLALPLTAFNGVQFGRWTTEDPRVSVCLSYIATVYSQKLKKEYIWLVQTDKTHKVLCHKGIKFYPLVAELRQENIPPDDLPYYTSDDSPKCYISIAQQQKEALEKKSHEITDTGYVIFEKNLL